jgi:Domain of unknown function (DUF4296)
MRLKGAIIIFIGIFISCSNLGKHGRIPENQLAKILADIHLADAVSFSGKFKDIYRNKDSVYYFEQIFSKYHVTRSQFDSTISWYSGNPDAYQVLYGKVLDRLNRMAATINDSLRADSIHSQAGNLWNRKRDWILPDDGPQENISFSLKIDKKGTYLISARIKINPGDQSDRPFMLAYLTNQQGPPASLDTTGRLRLDKTGFLKRYSVSLELDKDTVSYIKGFIIGHEPKSGNWIKSAEVRDIRIIHKSFNEFKAPE